MIGLILNVRRPNHFGSTKSISSLLIPWLLESPGRQHPCYWICKINKRPARAVMHVGIANPRWRGKRSRHSRRMRNPQFYVPGKRPIKNWPVKINLLPSLLLCSVCTEYCIMRYISWWYILMGVLSTLLDVCAGKPLIFCKSGASVTGTCWESKQLSNGQG